MEESNERPQIAYYSKFVPLIRVFLKGGRCSFGNVTEAGETRSYTVSKTTAVSVPGSSD